MGPIELVFLVIVIVLGVVGIVRGWARELGVTTMLLLTLFVLLFLDTELKEQVGQVLALLVGDDVNRQLLLKTVIYCCAFLVVIFITYQGETLSFPGKGKSPVLGFAAGILNGYLLAGSLWYYLAEAGWPLRLFEVSPNYSTFYQFAWELLPPKVLPWPYVIALAVFMLIMRVVK